MNVSMQGVKERRLGERDRSAMMSPGNQGSVPPSHVLCSSACLLKPNTTKTSKHSGNIFL